VFFALLAKRERIFYLDAQEWSDRTSTVLFSHDGRPLLIHAWYARQWATDATTRERYRRVMNFAHSRQQEARMKYRRTTATPAVEASSVTSMRCANPSVQILVCVHVYNRLTNIEHWLWAWHRCAHAGAQIVIVHNFDGPAPSSSETILRGRPDYYLPRANIGQDVGAFQDVVQGRFDKVLPAWEHLLWCTDDFLPLRRDFLDHFRTPAANPMVGLVAGRYGYWPGHFSGREDERHCRTIGFLIRRDVAQRLRFPAARVVSRDECLAFEHRPMHLMEQVQLMGYRVTALEDSEATIMWDANHEQALERWPLFEQAFGSVTGEGGSTNTAWARK
jgi:hypothetical protein